MIKIKFFIKEIINLITILFDSIIFLYPKKKEKLFDVCVVKVDALGDYILWLNSSYNFSLKYKGKRKILICNELIYELAKSTGHFEGIYTLNLKRFQNDFIYRFINLIKLRSIKVNILIQPTFSRNTLLGDSIARVISSRLKIGYFGDCTNQSFFLKLISNLWYSNLLEFEYLGQHEIEINIKMLNYLGIKKVKNYMLGNICKLEKIDFDFNKKYILVNPGASDHKRIWPTEKFILLIMHLLEKYDFYIILCGSNKDRKITNLIKKSIHNKRLLDFAGTTNINEFLEIVRLSQFVVGNDSSSIHIAYFLGIKSFCISGGNTFNRFVPYPKNINLYCRPKTFYNIDCKKNNWKCIKKYDCINMVSINEVLIEIDKYILKNIKNK